MQMRTRKSVRSLLEEEKPLITPLAHDALSARLIEKAGFKCIGIGGSPLLAARYGLPDLGLAALGEMTAGIADIVRATDLPVIVDADDGYGDTKNVAYTTDAYMRIGASGMTMEDQERARKQPGDSGSLGVVPTETMVRKLRAATTVRAGTDFHLVARCDAYAIEGMEGALRRGDEYLKAGADGIFITGVTRIEDLAAIGRHFHGAHTMTVMFEGRDTWLSPSRLYDLGFKQIVYPGVLLSRVVYAIDTALADLKAFADGRAPMTQPPNGARVQAALEAAVRLDRWQAVDGHT